MSTGVLRQLAVWDGSYVNGDMGLPARARAVAARQDGVLTREQVAALGVPRAVMRRIVRQGRWVWLDRGCYWVVADDRPPPLRTRVRAALLASGTDAVAWGPTAVRLHGVQGVPGSHGLNGLHGQKGQHGVQGVQGVHGQQGQQSAGTGSVHVARPKPSRPRDGVVLHRLGRRQTAWLRGLPVTTVVQSVADVLRTADRVTAVSVLDSALHQGQLPGGKAGVVQALEGYRGGSRARQLLREADGRAESPLETRGRLVCTDAGMPPEVLQWPLSDASGARYRIDLGWPSRGVGVEADGRGVHGAPEALYADRHRQNALLAAHAGLVLLRFTWRDAMQPDRFLATLRQALGRAP